MDATRLMTQTGILHLRTVGEDSPVDGYGNPQGVERDVFVPRCFLTPSRRADERDETEGGLATIQSETFDFFMPDTDDVDGLAAVTVDGNRFELIGPPSTWHHPKDRRTALLQATVRRAA